MKFGFVGLGQMGEPMAINLAQAHDVVVFGRNPEALASVTAHGAHSVRALADLFCMSPRKPPSVGGRANW